LKGVAYHAMPGPDTDAARRASLAIWISDKNNVLTWRSIVNRVWHYHFGRGICDTPGDLGRMGGMPSHPELLDYLAVWFRDDADGSLKRLHRLIVTSQTYKQSSQVRPDAAQIDGDNRLLWRFNSLRLDADSIRDITLQSSGVLDLTQGGPSIEQFSQRPGPQLTPALNYAEFDWSMPSAHRRSIYRKVWRGIADPFMDSLDFPDLGLLAPVRTFTSTALQSLHLYNNAFMLYAAEQLAKEVQKSPATGSNLNPTDAQLRNVIERVWLRPPSSAEFGLLKQYRDRAGLAGACRILLNSNEFLFVD
jgi:Protein of unknown function (DUF1553)